MGVKAYRITALSFFGLGKLGLPLAALFARSGLRTVAIDTNARLIDRLTAGEAPYVEPGLAELLVAARPAIIYTTSARDAEGTDASIILVPTPSDPSAPDFSSAFVEQACRDLAAILNARRRPRYHLIAISSTLLPGTTAAKIVPLLEEILHQRAGRDFGVAYVPDFVVLGDVVRGFQQPSSLLIGSDDPVAAANAVELYRRIVAPDTPIRVLSLRDAEITKVAHNVFCCLKVSFANFLAQLGDRLGGADIDGITEALALEPHICAGYLRAGGPFGGPCLPRDTLALRHFAQSLGLDAGLARSADEINAAQYDLIERHVMASRPRSVAVLGLSFKLGSPVTIASPSFELIKRFIGRSINVLAYDPIKHARDETRAAFGGSITCHDVLTETWRSAETILICNNHSEFTGLGAVVPDDRWIIDPWGCVKDQHPRLVRPGRKAFPAVADMTASPAWALGDAAAK